MTTCRHNINGYCRLNRYGGRPSPGACTMCQRVGHDRVAGIGDLVAMTLHSTPVVRDIVPKGCGGCAKRQRRLNAIGGSIRGD